MQTLIAQYASVLLIVGVALILLALRNTLHQFNQSRRAPYYILREEAARSAGRWAILSIAFIALTIVIAVVASGAPPVSTVEPTPTPTATMPAEVPTAGPSPTRTATPTRVRPTPTLTAAPTLTPTATVAPDVPFVMLTPFPNQVTPDPAAKFRFLTLASRFDANLNPLDAGLQFPAGTSRVYVIFNASNMNNGSPWGVFCYRANEIFDLFVALWDDGPRSQSARAFCGHDGSPGAYLIRAYIGTQLAFEVQYALVGESAPTPTVSIPPITTPAP